jgi:hypothetical protein
VLAYSLLANDSTSLGIAQLNRNEITFCKKEEYNLPWLSDLCISVSFWPVQPLIAPL